jgi:Zn finger protein HypA/HybF involved in hydrogenase expression
MAPSKKYNIMNPRKKTCDNCHKQIYVSRGKQKCPYCNSHKIHYVNGTPNLNILPQGQYTVQKRGF